MYAQIFACAIESPGLEKISALASVSQLADESGRRRWCKKSLSRATDIKTGIIAEIC